MKTLKLKISFIYNFALPAIFLNCIGIFILNLQNLYGIPPGSSAWIEAFKDFSILGGSFLLVSFIPKMGYRKSMIIGVLLELSACLLMAFFPSFLSVKIFLVLVGVAFALIKVSAYSAAGLITTNDKEHASFISLLEGFFMGAVLAGFWIFGLFMAHTKNGWINAFWFLSALCVVGLILLLISTIDESRVTDAVKKEGFQEGYKKMLVLLAKFIVWFFIVLTVLYLCIEQGIMNFLPLFNQTTLHISSAASVEIASFLSAGFALGRIVFGAIMKRIHWRKVLCFCMICSLAILGYAIYLSSQTTAAPTAVITHWSQFPWAAYLLPLVGFFVGPIYPVLCSSILSKQKLTNQSAMSVLILIFSAIGGTLGSLVVGKIFQHFGGIIAFLTFTVPLSVLLILVLPYAFVLKRSYIEGEQS